MRQREFLSLIEGVAVQVRNLSRLQQREFLSLIGGVAVQVRNPSRLQLECHHFLQLRRAGTFWGLSFLGFLESDHNRV